MFSHGLYLERVRGTWFRPTAHFANAIFKRLRLIYVSRPMRILVVKGPGKDSTLALEAKGEEEGHVCHQPSVDLVVSARAL